MSNDGGRRTIASRKNYYRRRQRDRQKEHPAPPGSDALVTNEQNGSPYKRIQRRQEAQPAAPGPVFKHIDIESFLALPLSIIANVIIIKFKFLALEDLTSLSRTSVKLRTFFMIKLSQPCWDQARWLHNVPEWKGVAAPRAAAFIFSTSCQGRGCNGIAPLKTFYVCKRYCKTCGPKYLLNAEELHERSDGIPLDLLSLLPWSKKRASTSEGNVDVGRFVLVEDVEYLKRRVTALDHDDNEALSALRAELQVKLKNSQAIAQRMEGWTHAYEASIWHSKNAQFVRFVKGLRERWGWNIKEMPQVTTKHRFDELLSWAESVPELNQTVWNRAELIMRDLIKEAEMAKIPSRRPWSLSKGDGSASDPG
ncbi:hypothetical protein FRC01_014438 [Tulasnella sp. 417]|nr:hypothetical protein FRC01_014438 [Tulasnella sp. 417]